MLLDETVPFRITWWGDCDPEAIKTGEAHVFMAEELAAAIADHDFRYAVFSEYWLWGTNHSSCCKIAELPYEWTFRVVDTHNEVPSVGKVKQVGINCVQGPWRDFHTDHWLLGFHFLVFLACGAGWYSYLQILVNTRPIDPLLCTELAFLHS